MYNAVVDDLAVGTNYWPHADMYTYIDNNARITIR